MRAPWLGLLAACFMMFLTGAAHADGIVESDGSDSGPLLLTMDRTGIIHLQVDAQSIVLNNEHHASVVLDNPRLLIITPHSEGATSMTVLDKNKAVILEKDIIVSNVQQSYVRIRRACSGNDASCQSASYSYCPDGCYNVTEVNAAASGSNVPPPPPSSKPGLIGGEPAETLIGPADECPEGYQKVYVQGVTTGDQHYTCTKR